MGPPGPQGTLSQTSQKTPGLRGLGRRRCSFYVLLSFASEVKIKNGTNSDHMFRSSLPLPRPGPPQSRNTSQKNSPECACRCIPLAGVSPLLCRKKMRLLYTLPSPCSPQARPQANDFGVPPACPSAAL
jgi:hypothetical protein